MNNRIIFLFVLVLSISSQTYSKTDSRYREAIFESKEIRVLSDLIYGESKTQSGAIQNQALDLYLPPNPKSNDLPLILLIHGGGFTQGDKAMERFADWARERFARKGYAVASINYRLRTSRPTSQVEKLAAELDALSDARSAIRYLRSHASEYHLDQHRIASFGVSAGAIISLLISATSNVDRPLSSFFPGVNENQSNPGVSSAVCASISVSGAMVSEFRDAFIDPKDPVILEFHGEKDFTVDYQESVKTVDAFKTKGVPTEFFSFPGKGHALPGDSVEEKLLPLLEKYLVKEPCA